VKKDLVLGLIRAHPRRSACYGSWLKIKGLMARRFTRKKQDLRLKPKQANSPDLNKKTGSA
jgi:hypothetical protein